MLERASTAKQDRELSLRKMIGQRVADIFGVVAARSIDGHEFHHGSIEELFSDYFEAEKQFGTFDEERLMQIGVICLAYVRTETIPSFFKIDALELGASALREAAFAQSVACHNSIDTVDERLELVEAADHMLTVALRLSEPGSERSHRLALQQSFTPVHMDIVSGDVTRETVDDIHNQLTHHHQNAYRIANRSVGRGLQGEIETLQHFWNHYEKKGQHIALPATMRGGSGNSHPEQTHDIDVIRQKVDGSWIVLPAVEVKRTEITDEMRRRYTRSLLARVGTHGTVTFISDHREKAAQ